MNANLYYVPGDYVDPSTSESQSEINSPYDMGTYYPQGSETNLDYVPLSPRETNEECPETAPISPSAKPPPPPSKRKRENRYKNATPSVLSRRRAQNRASQRAYRERKDQRIKDLESMLMAEQHKNNQLTANLLAVQAELVKYRTSQYAAMAAATAVSAPGVALTAAPGTNAGPGPVPPVESFGAFDAVPGTQADGSGLAMQSGGMLFDYSTMGSMYGQL